MARIRRIAIALGNEAPDARALDRIARLAAGMRAEMTGLFVEDIDLLHLAALPFAAEFSRFTQRHRPLHGAELERQLRIQAAAAQRALAAAAERAGVKWSFRVSRGSVVALLLQAAAEMDLLALGASRRILLRESDFGFAVQAAAHRALQAEAPDRPLVVVGDGTAPGKRALEVARQLADADARPLTVLLIAPDQQGVERLQREAAQQIGEQRPQYRQVVDPTVGTLLTTVRSENAAMLVLPASPPVLETSAFKMLRENLSCPALLVR
jgi:nucleotide-binding universal stress UspA family protein